MREERLREGNRKEGVQRNRGVMKEERREGVEKGPDGRRGRRSTHGVVTLLALLLIRVISDPLMEECRVQSLVHRRVNSRQSR